MFLQIIGWYALIGIIVNVFDLVHEKLTYPTDFEDFKEDVRGLGINGVLLSVLIYIIFWPAIAWMTVNDTFERITEKIKF